MTTVAFKAGVLASDTKAVGEEGLIFKSKKLEKLPNGTLLGCAGDSDCRDVIRILSKASLTRMPSKSRLRATETTFHSIWVFPTGQVFRVTIECISDNWDAEILPILEPQAATGTGGAYALGAMLAGKSAVEAVRIACKLDNNSGLPVESISFDG